MRPYGPHADNWLRPSPPGIVLPVNTPRPGSSGSGDPPELRQAVPNDPLTLLEAHLSDRYRFEGRLGEGGMATVLLATDLKHGRRVAVKVLRPEIAALVGAQRFLTEIRVTAGLQHPHILPLFDSGEVDGLLYYVMPHATGQTLRERLDQQPPLSIEEALEIARSIASALDYAHRQGIIHRDVKPENILLQDGQALLADFGISFSVGPQESDRLTRIGGGLGTALYMSPEQAFGEGVGPESDVYSLGCVLFEMLAGAPPFTGSSPRNVSVRHSADPVPELRRHRPDLDAALAAVIQKSMAKQLEDRYPTAGAFAEALASPRTRGGFRARYAVFGAVAVAALAAVAWALTTRDDASLDPNRVLVYPLVLPAGFSGPASLGEDVATMIGHALDGTGPLRWLDGWTLLDPDTRDDIRKLSLDRARDLARARGSAFFVMGRLVGRGDSADVFLDLHAVDGDDVVARGQATGLLSDAWKPGLTAVNDLLPALIPGGGVTDVATDWKDRNPSAIANFLLGEAAFRRVHLGEALDRYRDAVAADSTFAVAAIRGAQAAQWNHRPREAVSLLEVALKQPLPPRYRHFARGYDHYLRGQADSAAAELRLALEADPDMAGAWMQLGEVYTHLLPLTGEPDSLADAAFTEARRLDPRAANILLHPIEIRLRRGDVDGAAPLIRQFLAAGPDTTEAAKVQLLDACVRGGPASVDWNGEAAKRPLVVLFAGRSMAGEGARFRCAEAAYDALLQVDTARTDDADGRRWVALVGRFSAAVAHGEIDAAEAFVDGAVERWGYGSTLYLLGSIVAPSLEQRAWTVARGDEAKFGRNFAQYPSTVRLWEVGVLEARRGRPEVAEAMARELHRQARDVDSTYDGHLARSLEGFVSLARGDTTGAMETFTALVPQAFVALDLQWDELEPRGAERLTLAELYLARGDAGRALDIASVFDSSWPLIHMLYLPASLELRAQAASILGDSVRAALFRERLRALGSGSPP